MVVIAKGISGIAGIGTAGIITMCMNRVVAATTGGMRITDVGAFKRRRNGWEWTCRIPTIVLSRRTDGAAPLAGLNHFSHWSFL